MFSQESLWLYGDAAIRPLYLLPAFSCPSIVAEHGVRKRMSGIGAVLPAEPGAAGIEHDLPSRNENGIRTLIRKSGIRNERNGNRIFADCARASDYQ